MEMAIRDAKARLSQLIVAARNGERVIITKHGTPTAELIRCDRRSGIDFEKLDAARERLGVVDAPPDEVEAMQTAIADTALSRRVLGLSEDD